MSNLWPHFTKENPCPACGHWDWSCRAGDRKFLCMRIQSEHSSQDGGWYHEYGEKFQKPVRQLKLPPQKNLNIQEIWDSEFGNAGLCGGALAQELGVSESALDSFPTTWFELQDCWAMPMRDGKNKIIGINRRYKDGSKKSLGNLGLFVPQVESKNVIYLPEGASDTAALLTMGFYAVGRPSCNFGGHMIREFVQRLKINWAVIVADNDGVKFGGRRPGKEGAEKLKREIGIKSVIWMPPNPCKDVRELCQKIGYDSAKKLILSDISHKIWTK